MEQYIHKSFTSHDLIAVTEFTGNFHILSVYVKLEGGDHEEAAPQAVATTATTGYYIIPVPKVTRPSVPNVRCCHVTPRPPANVCSSHYL